MRILVAEDDPALGSFVRKGLEAEHYAVDVSADGEQARAMAGELDFDLVVLDLNLPRLDGVSILRFLRTRKPSMPILVLTGRTRVEDRVQCLDLGADDYLGKPFSFTELSARIRALMRRSHLPAESVLTVDDLKLDRVERRVERAGRRIELTSKEFALLEYLMRNAGRRITRAMIIEHVWNLWKLARFACLPAPPGAPRDRASDHRRSKLIPRASGLSPSAPECEQRVR